MNLGTEQVEEQNKKIDHQLHPKLILHDDSPSPCEDANPHSAFQKNYPKNIFIPIIEHLSERGLQKEYEECVGTREGFEGKNVVSLAEIHRVMSQQWFSEGINLAALVSSMSNKILMNSKIKKKLFHLLLIRQLFTIPLHDPREFKKLVSKKANEVAESKLPDHPLFQFPSALIYLLHIFAEGLSRHNHNPILHSNPNPHNETDLDTKQKTLPENEEKKLQGKGRRGETSSKLQYKFYISKIIVSLNTFQGDTGQFLDLMQEIKQRISQRQSQIRQTYNLPEYVPEWSYFNSIVINNCCLMKRDRLRLTYSLLNTWIQQFKERATSLKGFIEIVSVEETKEPEREYKFTPIVLISPP